MYRDKFKLNIQNYNSNYLFLLDNNFVLCPLGKAINNYGIVCKKYYIMVILKEIGFDVIDDLVQNNTYVDIYLLFMRTKEDTKLLNIMPNFVVLWA